jgi:hypothetical protein
MHAAVIGIINSQYIENLKHETRRGLRERAKAGLGNYRQIEIEPFPLVA